MGARNISNNGSGTHIYIKPSLVLMPQVEETLAILKLLDKPSPPTVQVRGPREVYAQWQESRTRSGLNITYKLFEGEYMFLTLSHSLSLSHSSSPSLSDSSLNYFSAYCGCQDSQRLLFMIKYFIILHSCAKLGTVTT